MASKHTLVADIWYKIASEFLTEASDVFNPARTCHPLWATLLKQIYVTGVLQFKTQEEIGQLRHFAYDQINRQHIAGGGDPEGPMCGIFPDEFKWDFGEELEITKRMYVRKLKYLRDPQNGSPSNDSRLLFYERELAALPDPLPDRVPPLSVLQWAAINGITSTASEVIDAAKKFWLGYLYLARPQNLHKPIRLAIINSHLNMAQLVVDFGAASPMTTSGLACLAPKMLLEAIAHVAPDVLLEKVRTYSSCKYEYPFVFDALGLSISRSHEELASWLFERYDIHQFRETPEITNPSLDLHKDFDQRPATCPLHLAALLGMNHIVQELLKKGVPANFVCRQFKDSTALMWACARPGNVAVIETLIKGGANVLHKDIDGRTALIWALEHRNPEAASLLIKAGVPVDEWLPHKKEVCALGLSVAHDLFLDCTKLILRIHPDLPPTFLAHCYYLAQQASRNIHGEVVAFVNKETVLMFIEGDIGQGPVEYELPDFERQSFRRGLIGLAESDTPLSLSFMGLLLDDSTDNINTPDEDGNTPLLLASRNKLVRSGAGMERISFGKPDWKRMKLLLDFGADPRSCLDLVEESEHESDPEPDEDYSLKQYQKSPRDRRKKRGMSKKEVLTRWFAEVTKGNYSRARPTQTKSKKPYDGGSQMQL